jgi:hypothetical protein
LTARGEFLNFAPSQSRFDRCFLFTAKELAFIFAFRLSLLAAAAAAAAFHFGLALETWGDGPRL